jgi:hypothetical protein
MSVAVLEAAALVALMSWYRTTHRHHFKILLEHLGHQSDMSANDRECLRQTLSSLCTLRGAPHAPEMDGEPMADLGYDPEREAREAEERERYGHEKELEDIEARVAADRGELGRFVRDVQGRRTVSGGFGVAPGVRIAPGLGDEGDDGEF